MKNKRKRFAAAIVAAVLAAGTLAGCGGGEASATPTEDAGSPQNVADAGGGKNTAKGRYLETDIEIPEGADKIYGMGKLADGSVIVAAGAGGTGFIFQSQDMGETWETKAGIDGLADSWIEGSTVMPDGTVVLAGYFMDIDDMEEQQLVLVAPDGTRTNTPVILPPTDSELSSGNLVSQIACDRAGNLFVMDLNDDILKVDTATGVCSKALDWTGSRPAYFGIAGETLMLLTDDGVPCFKTTDGSSLPDSSALDDIVRTDYSIVQRASENTFPMVVTEGIEEGSVVYANHNGVFYYKEGGSISEQLVSGELSSMGVTESYHSILMLDEENFLVHLVNGMGKQQICRYSYDKDVPSVPEKELNIYALEDSQALRQAVSVYQKENQNVYVRLRIGMTGTDGISAEDAIRTLNTEILAGNVPDVLILDGLPVESYIEKGILADIGSVVDRMDQSDGIFANIRDVYRKDEGCYQFPARFFLMMATGSPDGVAAAATLEGFADYAQKLGEENPGRRILTRNPAKELLWNLYQIDSASWFDEEGGLKEGALRNFLTQAKRLYDLDSYPDDIGGMHVYRGSPVGTARPEELMANETKLDYGTVVDMTDFVGQFAACESADTVCAPFGDGTGFIPCLLTGISSSTDAKEEAEEFFLTLSGAECSSTDGDGFPVNRTAWETLKAYAAEQYGPESQISIGYSTPDGGSNGYMMNTMTEENLAVIEELLEGAATPANTDAVMKELVLGQGLRYLKGESSLEDAVSALEQKISLYLAE